MLLHCLEKLRKLNLFESLLMYEDAHATRQLHYQLCNGPFHGKDSASVASLHHCYTPMIDDLAACCMTP